MRQVQCGLATIHRGAEGVTVSVGIIWCLRNIFVLWQPLLWDYTSEIIGNTLVCMVLGFPSLAQCYYQKCHEAKLMDVLPVDHDIW